MSVVAEICMRYDNEPAALLEILHDLQAAQGWIHGEHLPELGRLLGRSRAEIYGVVSFYADFRTEPAAQHCLRVCRGEACQAAGGVALMERARGQASDATEVGEVFCLGNCALGPALQADGKLYGLVDDSRLAAILAEWT